jgi:hypothetical protein
LLLHVESCAPGDLERALVAEPVSLIRFAGVEFALLDVDQTAGREIDGRRGIVAVAGPEGAASSFQ